MVNIEIHVADFSRLQSLAVPLVDTTADVVTRLLDSYETIEHETQPGQLRSAPNSNSFGVQNLPPMKHAKLLSAKFGEAEPEKTTWDSLVLTALVMTLGANGESVPELRRISGANVVTGKKISDGYKFVPTSDFSYQGVSATDAIKIIIRCAKALNKGIFLDFEWHNKEGAFKPGERANFHMEA